MMHRRFLTAQQGGITALGRTKKNNWWWLAKAVAES